MTKKQNKYICLYTNVMLVQGAKKSILISFRRAKIFEISNSVAFITSKFRSTNIQELYLEFPQLEEKLLEYFEFLIKNDLGFYTDEINRFPEIDSHYETPSILENCIIEINEEYQLDKFKNIIAQLDTLGVEYVELRSFKPISAKKLKLFLETFDETGMIGLDLILCYDKSYTYSLSEKLVLEFQRIANIYLHSSPFNNYGASMDYVLNNDMGKVYYLKQELESSSCCGVITKNSLTIGSLQNYFHNKSYNSCLNKKISIDLDGNISNCPSIKFSFGNINKKSLNEVVKIDNFKTLWKINKDSINICKDCEFRYICTDCRAYIEDPDDNFSKPLKCGYDPYSGIWSDWSLNPLKTKAIKYYNELL